MDDEKFEFSKKGRLSSTQQTSSASRTSCWESEKRGLVEDCCMVVKTKALLCERGRETGNKQKKRRGFLGVRCDFSVFFFFFFFFLFFFSSFFVCPFFCKQKRRRTVLLVFVFPSFVFWDTGVLCLSMRCVKLWLLLLFFASSVLPTPHQQANHIIAFLTPLYVTEKNYLNISLTRILSTFQTSQHKWSQFIWFLPLDPVDLLTHRQLEQSTMDTLKFHNVPFSLNSFWTETKMIPIEPRKKPKKSLRKPKTEKELETYYWDFDFESSPISKQRIFAVIVSQKEGVPYRKRTWDPGAYYYNFLHTLLPSHLYVYHMDLDNTIPCKFFNVTSAYVPQNFAMLFDQRRLWHNKYPLTIHGSMRAGSVDTGNFLCRMKEIQESQVIWPPVPPYKHGYPDATFIIELFKYLKENNSPTTQIHQVLSYWNRLKWPTPVQACVGLEGD